LLETLHIVCESDYLTIEPRVLVELKLFSNSIVNIPIHEAFDPRDVCLISRRSCAVDHGRAGARKHAGFLFAHAARRRFVKGAMR
jgi:hypothetical protein